MTPTISSADYNLLCQNSSQAQHYGLNIEKFEKCRKKPKNMGQTGFTRQIELTSGIELEIYDWKFDRSLIIDVPVHQHEIQLLILTSGCLTYNEVYPTIQGKHSYLSGSGISPAYQVKYSQAEHVKGINIHIEPEVFRSFIDDLDCDNSAFTKLFSKQDEWKTSFFPKVTPKIRALVWQIVNTPYRGMTKKLYLQAKVLELMAMQLDPVIAEFDSLSTKPTLKPQTIDRIYQAKDILVSHLENPPSITELTKQVGIGDRTLRRGFRELFGTTVIGYLTSQRMKQAEQLLREGKLSISEIANIVGYSHLGHFSAAFQRHFGITPSQCSVGKKSL